MGHAEGRSKKGRESVGLVQHGVSFAVRLAGLELIVFVVVDEMRISGAAEGSVNQTA